MVLSTPLPILSLWLNLVGRGGVASSLRSCTTWTLIQTDTSRRFRLQRLWHFGPVSPVKNDGFQSFKFSGVVEALHQSFDIQTNNPIGLYIIQYEPANKFGSALHDVSLVTTYIIFFIGQRWSSEHIGSVPAYQAKSFLKLVLFVYDIIFLLLSLIIFSIYYVIVNISRLHM